MPEPITLALGVAIGKLLLRWTDLNDTADAVEDARAGFRALKTIGTRRAVDPVGAAITELLEQRLTGVSDATRREQMRIAVSNVAALFSDLSDDDIRAAAQHPGGFPDYLAGGPAQTLLRHTDEALAPFTRQLIDAGAKVFAELAPRSGRFTAAALVRLLENLEAAIAGISGVHGELTAARMDLLAATDAVAVGIAALHAKFDLLLALNGGADEDNESDEDDETEVTPAAVKASRAATSLATHVGRPVTQWPPSDLGVHASITVYSETNLTSYIPRHHDQELRGHLNVVKTRSEAGLVLVVGTSCTGKTRTLYEAVSAVLPDWQLIAPRTDRDLAMLLQLGVPAHTVVWLDELQNRIPSTPDGVNATRDMLDMLETLGLGPILFAGTLWPTTFAAMGARPSPAVAATGAGTIPALLAKATVVEVPECFTAADLVDITLDPRLRKALSTASQTTDPPDGVKITQLLAGGTQLVQRVHPPAGTYQPDEFSPAAKAVLHAAAEIARVGMLNPIPRWAIEGAAPAYLHPADFRPTSQWFQRALDETTRAAILDDYLTGTRTLDIHRHGVPALTPRWMPNPNNELVEAFDLHDYLLQDHLTRYGHTPTLVALWTTLTSRPVRPDTARRLADDAANRGLLTPAIDLLRPLADAGNRDEQLRIAKLLAQRGGAADLAELRARASARDLFALHGLVDLLAERGGPEDLAELRALADAGDWAAHRKTIDLLGGSANSQDLEELRSCADAGDVQARNWLAHILAVRGDPKSLAELRARANFADWEAQDRLVDILANRGDPEDILEIRSIVAKDNAYAKYRLGLLLARSDQHGGDLAAHWNLRGPRSKDQLAQRNDPENLTELRARVLAGTGGSKLLSMYRETSAKGYVQELDCDANPVQRSPGGI